jgi:3-hydroxyacyl-[acyl-carrier-protein] dehydratase
MNPPQTLSLEEIQKILPHRYPFLLVDRITSLEKGKRIVGLKNVSINEPFFQGHFPGRPIMPGVLIAEAMAQVGAVMVMNSKKDQKIVPYLAAINNLRWKKPVVPGDTLVIRVDMIGGRGHIGKVSGKATVGDKVVATGEMSFALVPEKEQDDTNSKTDN